MIKKMTVTNPNLETWPLSLEKPEVFIVHEIAGLGPAKSTINSKANAGKNGSTFNSSKTSERNIVITLEFLESTGDELLAIDTVPTIEKTRLLSYKFFLTESRIKLEFETDAGNFYIWGYVESNEPDIFSQNEGCVISVLCLDPFFKKIGEGEETLVVAPTEKLFQFHSKLEEPPVPLSAVINFGTLAFRQSDDIRINNGGTIVVAPTFTIKADGGSVSNPSISFRNPSYPDIEEVLSFTFTEDCPQLEDGDILEIVCEQQNKSVKRYVNGAVQGLNYLSTVDIDSAWPVLLPGDNLFSYFADSGKSYIQFGYSYSKQYVGI